MKICYFGTYNKGWGRSKIYMRGLRELGLEVLECQSIKSGLGKYLELFRKHQKINNTYDYLVVGYPGHAVVWFAALLSNKKVIFDALCTMEEGVMISRREVKSASLKGLYIKFLDWLSVKCADVVLVESEEQRKYFEKKFGKSSKYKVLYTGADDSVFCHDDSVKKKDTFTALFRGKFLPEAGVKYIIEAAKLLHDSGVNFLVIGNGWLENDIRLQITDCRLRNLELVTENLSDNELREKMFQCHVSLGQFEKHDRLSRTIPHKCFESLALGLPYITARAEPIAEILKDRESVLFVNRADPQDLADKILMLKNDPSLAEKIAQNGYKVYQQKFTPKVLSSKILEIIRSNS